MRQANHLGRACSAAGACRVTGAVPVPGSLPPAASPSEHLPGAPELRQRTCLVRGGLFPCVAAQGGDPGSGPGGGGGQQVDRGALGLRRTGPSLPGVPNLQAWHGAGGLECLRRGC